MKPSCLFLVFTFGLLAGCAPRRPVSFPHIPVADGHGVPLRTFRDASIQLYGGQDVAAVWKLLGEPDETEQAVFGNATGHPWNCQTWIYKFSGLNGPVATFEAHFVVTSTNQTLNDWHWHDY